MKPVGEARQGIAPGAWWALTLVALCNAMALLDRNILSILAPKIKADLHIGDSEMGLLYGSLFALFYALFSLPLGRLSDGWLRNRILSVSIGFWSIMNGLAAFASGFGLFVASRLGVGIGEASSQPAGTSLLYDYFPKHRRGLVMAVIAASIALGLGVSFVLGGVAAEWWDTRYAGVTAPFGFRGWQFAFLVASAPGLILSVLLWWLREPVRGLMDGIVTPPDPAPFRASAAVLGAVTPGTNFISLAARKAGPKHWLTGMLCIALVVPAMAVMIRATSAFSPRPSLDVFGLMINPHLMQWSIIGFGVVVIFNLLQGMHLSDPVAYRLIVKSPSVVLVLAVGALQTSISYGVMGFTPTFLMQHYGESPTETALRFGILSGVVGIIGPMIAGPLSDWLVHKLPGAGRVYVIMVALGVSPFIALMVYHAPNAFQFYVWFILYSLILTAWLPPLYAVLYDLVLPRLRGTMASTFLITQTIFGMGMGPYVVGIVSDANGHKLGSAILTLNWVAVPITIMLILLAFLAGKDEALMIPRAKEAGEPI